MSFFKLFPAMPILMIVTACAQPEPAPEPIAPEPVYNKYGNESGGGCTGGQTAGTNTNCIPPTGQQSYDDTNGGTNGGTSTVN